MLYNTSFNMVVKTQLKIKTIKYQIINFCHLQNHILYWGFCGYCNYETAKSKIMSIPCLPQRGGYFLGHKIHGEWNLFHYYDQAFVPWFTLVNTVDCRTCYVHVHVLQSTVQINSLRKIPNIQYNYFHDDLHEAWTVT